MFQKQFLMNVNNGESNGKSILDIILASHHVNCYHAMNQLKKLLALECSYQLPDPIMDRFLEAMQPIELQRGEILIDTGSVNPDIYVVKEGIFCYNYIDGIHDRCHAFAMPGTMMYSSHSYYLGKPAFYQIQACCDSVAMHCTKQVFDCLVNKYHEFACWALSMAHCQLYYSEMKSSVINGNAAERLVALTRYRPEILEKVQMKTLASYLGITQQYLSTLKRKLKNH